ncbi:protein ALP1-like [Zingiber officinale]|uniref:protein ALP1-like n=1 Tax=Zingiber officinale TaxID=94328 RepID=UPI001C4AE02D|nr:protein ALP1-like [Zingiber officinale]
MGLSPLQKCTAALRQLAYGAPADQSDEYLRFAETTAIDGLINFCKCVYEIFGDQYLRRPTVADTQHLLEMHERRHGFSGMLGSRNDINVLYESPLFNKILEGGAPEVYFTINAMTYTKGYYLTDGIYPTWATFVKSFPCPEDPKRKKFKKRQEAARKDVEQAFGVLQARWAIVRGLVRYWSRDILRDIMYTCIILHNMIIEDEGEAVSNWMGDEENHPMRVKQGSTPEFQEYFWRNCELRDSETHHQLRADLVEHIWAL